jgi:predicted extracellular nuclease
MRQRMALLAVTAAAGSASAQVYFTEWMYNGGTEFIEVTNTGAVGVNMGSWSFDDNSQTPGSLDLSAFGTLAPGESAIITEVSIADFEVAWNLPAESIKIIGGNTQNLSRADEINLYDDGNVLVDRLTYGDQVFVGSIRTNAISGVPISPAALGANDVFQWKFSVVGDEYNSYSSQLADVGNPGLYVPAPAAGVLLAGAGLSAARRRRA